MSEIFASRWDGKAKRPALREAFLFAFFSRVDNWHRVPECFPTMKFRGMEGLGRARRPPPPRPGHRTAPHIKQFRPRGGGLNVETHNSGRSTLEAEGGVGSGVHRRPQAVVGTVLSAIGPHCRPQAVVVAGRLWPCTGHPCGAAGGPPAGHQIAVRPCRDCRTITNLEVHRKSTCATHSHAIPQSRNRAWFVVGRPLIIAIAF